MRSRKSFPFKLPSVEKIVVYIAIKQQQFGTLRTTLLSAVLPTKATGALEAACRNVSASVGGIPGGIHDDGLE